MPRIEGKKSTRITVPLDQVEIGSFVGAWEHFAKDKICCIEGCGHVVSGRRATIEELEASDRQEWWIHCEGATNSVDCATVYDKREPEDKRGHRGLLICSCCLSKVDAGWRVDGHLDQQ